MDKPTFNDPQLESRVKKKLRRFSRDEQLLDAVYWSAITYVWSRIESPKPKQTMVKDWRGCVQKKAMSLLVDEFRRVKRFVSLPTDDLLVVVEMDPTQEEDNSDELERLNGALECLPEELRKVIEWKYWGKRSIDEIAKELAVSRATVGRLLRNAMCRLKSALKSD